MNDLFYALPPNSYNLFKDISDMCADFVSIAITDDYRKILDRNKEKIINFYKLSGEDLELIEVMVKINPESGTYYKFTVRDQDKKTVVAKVDDLHTRSRWDAKQWANTEVANL